MRFKVLVPVPDEEYMLKEVQVELTDDLILAIGDRYLKLKEEQATQNKSCDTCIFATPDGICNETGCDKKYGGWKYGGVK